MQIKTAHSIIVGDPISEIGGKETKGSEIIVGDPWVKAGGSQSGSGGAPATVAKFNPCASTRPEMTEQRMRAQVNAKLNARLKRLRAWAKGELQGVEAAIHNRRKHPKAATPHFGASVLFHRKETESSNLGPAPTSEL